MVSPYDLSVHGGVQGQVSGLAAAIRLTLVEHGFAVYLRDGPPRPLSGHAG